MAASAMNHRRTASTAARAGASRATRFAQSVGAKTIGKGLATVAITVLVLNQIFSVEAINNSSGPFTDVISQVESIGSSALVLVVVSFLVLAGAIAMRYMDRF